MGREESFASRLASGNADIPPKAAWWARHLRATTGYLASPAKASYIRTIREAALGHASEWDLWTPAAVPKGAMRRHAALEAELVDAARTNDARRVETVGGLLLRNAADQAAQLGGKVASFPEERFRRLLEEHVSIFAEHVRVSLEKGDLRASAKRAEANALALAAFTVEWF